MKNHSNTESQLCLWNAQGGYTDGARRETFSLGTHIILRAVYLEYLMPGKAVAINHHFSIDKTENFHQCHTRSGICHNQWHSQYACLYK